MRFVMKATGGARQGRTVKTSFLDGISMLLCALEYLSASSLDLFTYEDCVLYGQKKERLSPNNKNTSCVLCLPEMER